MTTCNLDGLTGCQAPKNTPRQALEDPVLAPFVKITVKGKANAIVAQAVNDPAVAQDYGQDVVFGVGNKSFPAVVKSFQNGASNGCGFEIEIIDQEGGDFSKIFE